MQLDFPPPTNQKNAPAESNYLCNTEGDKRTPSFEMTLKDHKFCILGTGDGKTDDTVYK